MTRAAPQFHSPAFGDKRRRESQISAKGLRAKKKKSSSLACVGFYLLKVSGVANIPASILHSRSNGIDQKELSLQIKVLLAICQQQTEL